MARNSVGYPLGHLIIWTSQNIHETMAPIPQSNVDVLIVGAGPAGLMLALWLSRLGIITRIIDKRTDKVFSGQADGLANPDHHVTSPAKMHSSFQARTLEILDSFGIGERVWKEANQMFGMPLIKRWRHRISTFNMYPNSLQSLVEVSFWNPNPDGRIQRNSRVSNNVAGLSRFTESVLHQGRMEKFFLDGIAASYPHPATPTHRIKVERMVIPTSLSIDEAKVDDDDAYPLIITLQHLTEEEATPTQRLSNLSDGLFRSNLADDDIPQIIEQSSVRKDVREEVVKAKYVVGCDGAHSWTRKTLGKDFEMHGEMTDYIWGVLDIVPITDFRKKYTCSSFVGYANGD